ncbi:hypothetical protein V6R21_11455 [Limibacter armeniacum]|uniref:hypothetical protein n=1 Tax=Limibacter armeniacum TaxID=466084 RepID=UPI002FE5529C
MNRLESHLKLDEKFMAMLEVRANSVKEAKFIGWLKKVYDSDKVNFALASNYMIETFIFSCMAEEPEEDYFKWLLYARDLGILHLQRVTYLNREVNVQVGDRMVTMQGKIDREDIDCDYWEA